MQLKGWAVALGVVFAGGCATKSEAPMGVSVGKFATFSCDGGKSFQARWSETGTVRVRGHHGAAELAKIADGVYEGEGYRLVTNGPGAIELIHGDKSQGRGCKVA